MSIKILSTNACGLADNFKWKQLFNYIKKRKVDILFLQETHSVKNKNKIWRSQWRGPCYWDHGSNDARGVAILISPSLNLTIKRCVTSGKGRYIMLEGELDGKSVVLLNAYAPNGPNLEFFVPLLEEVTTLSPEIFIIGRDLNVHLNHKLDKKDQAKSPTSKAAEFINVFLEENDWVDVWHTIYPHRFQFTFKHRTPLVMTHLDYFLVPRSTFFLVESCEIIPGFLSDHAFIELVLSFEWSIRGKGLWKLNTSLLSNKEYVEEINIIKETEQNMVAMGNSWNPVAGWKNAKYRIQRFSHKFSQDLARIRKEKVNLLTDKLSKVEKRLAMINLSSPKAIHFINKINIKIDSIKAELNKEMRYVAQGAILRAKVRWYTEGEHNSKYFFTLEKNRS